MLNDEPKELYDSPEDLSLTERFDIIGEVIEDLEFTDKPNRLIRTKHNARKIWFQLTDLIKTYDPRSLGEMKENMSKSDWERFWDLLKYLWDLLKELADAFDGLDFPFIFPEINWEPDFDFDFEETECVKEDFLNDFADRMVNHYRLSCDAAKKPTNEHIFKCKTNEEGEYECVHLNECDNL